jgi:hypothetical protein
MHVDFKITKWERIEIPSESEAEVEKGIKEGKLRTSTDVWNILSVGEANLEELDDTTVQMSVKENEGASTIELFEERGQDPIWSNGV